MERRNNYKNSSKHEKQMFTTKYVLYDSNRLKSRGKICNVLLIRNDLNKK